MVSILKTPENYGYEVAAMFGTDAHLLAKAKALGVQISQTIPGTYSIKHPASKSPFGTVLVKSQYLTLVKNGTMGGNSKAAFKVQFESALQKAVAQHSKPAENQAAPATPTFSFPGKSPAQWPQGTQTVEHADATTKGGVPKVKLKDATKLFQPVFSTTPTSTYWVCGLFTTLKFAARYKGNMLSLRCEGPGLAAYADKLKEELMLESSGDYMSGHFEVPNEALLRKALAAPYAVIGYENALATPSMKDMLEYMK